MDDESGESMELMEEVPLKELGESYTHTHTHPFNGPLSGTREISAWLTKRSRELIPETTVKICSTSLFQATELLYVTLGSHRSTNKLITFSPTI